MADTKDTDADGTGGNEKGSLPEDRNDKVVPASEPVKVSPLNKSFELGEVFKKLRIGEITRGLGAAYAIKGFEVGEVFRRLRLGDVARSIEIGHVVKGLEIGEAFKQMRLGDIGRGLEAAQVVKNLEIGRTFKTAELASVVQGLESAHAFKSLNTSLAVEGRQIGDTFRELTKHAALLDMNKDFLSLGRTIQEFRALPIGIVANSNFMRSLTFVGTAVTQLDRLTVESGAAIFRAAQAAAELSTAFKSTLPEGMLSFLNSQKRTQLFDLIHSGQIDVEQVVEDFEGAALYGDAAKDVPGLEGDITIADAHNEVVNALLNRGSLKGISPAGMRYFIFFMVFVVLPAIVAFANQSFELQKTLGGLFTGVESPAEARAQARHLPEGAEKSQLTGFRVITGESVYLMEDPSRKAEEILKIRIGSLVQVLDSAKNSWLYVSVFIDGELYEGWVFRRYTKRIE